MTYSDIISNRILELCNERKWSINLVATLAELPYSTVNKIVLKERHNPTILTIHSIAKAFDMDLIDFLDVAEIKQLTQSDLKIMRDMSKNKK